LPALRPSELLVVNKDDSDKRRLVALDVDSLKCRLIHLDEVALPTISNGDRDRIYYLFPSGEPRRAQADGLTGRAWLLQPDERAQCPFSTRPSESTDGSRVALVCRDESGNVKGLYMADRDGSDLVTIVENSIANQGPTWQGQDTIYYISAEKDDDESSLLMRVPAEEDAVPERIDELASGWLSDPDAFESGVVLFLRSPAKKAPGDVFRFDYHTKSEDKLTTRGDATSPTWSPDGSQFAFLAPVREADSRLAIWIQKAEVGATARAITITIKDRDGNKVEGALGPPAWGPR
jgi:dipeptidyl aminopeptidase/acylaminoacyl peptidase